MRLIQPIVVKPASHETTVIAAAIASASLLAQADLSLPSAQHWRDWLAADFAKHVRYTRKHTKFSTVFETNTPYVLHAVGEAMAVALEPHQQHQRPEAVARLHLTGLDAPRTVPAGEVYTAPAAPGSLAPRVIVNSEVSMSTGKTAAQAAHGLCLWVLTEDRDVVAEWLQYPGAQLVTTPLHDIETHDDDVRVIDSGLTEIPAGTPTVTVTRRSSEV